MSILSKIGNLLTGTSKDAGILGVGQYKADPYKFDESAFLDSRRLDDRQDALERKLGRVEARKSDSISPAQIAAMNQVSGAKINTAPQDQVRSQQMALISALQAQAAGNGPSLAQTQLRSATDANIAQAMALAASQRGGSAGGLGLRQINQQTSNLNQQAATQSALLRAQEQMAAQQQLAGVLDTTRGADIGLATNQASFNQQASLSNQQALNQAKLAQAQLTQQARQSNLEADMQQRALNDAQARFYDQNIIAMDQDAQQRAMLLEQLRAQQHSGIAGVNADAYQAAGKSRAEMASGMGSAMAKAGMFGSALASDERLKNVTAEKSDTKKDIQDFVKAIGYHKYTYKDHKFGEGEYVSPMAQELEKTALGKDMVIDTPEGKMVNYARGFGTMLATAGMLNERLDELEKVLTKRKQRRA
jgi:hypothetical protein